MMQAEIQHPVTQKTSDCSFKESKFKGGGEVEQRRRLSLENIQDYKHHLESEHFMHKKQKTPKQTIKKTNITERKTAENYKNKVEEFLLVRRQHY